MTNDEMRDLVKECGLDWHRGFMPLFDDDSTNRYAVLIEAVVSAERERGDAAMRQRLKLTGCERFMRPQEAFCALTGLMLTEYVTRFNRWARPLSAPNCSTLGSTTLTP